MANSNGWGDGAANNSIGWGQGANNNIGWGDSHSKSWAGLTDIVGIDSDAQAFITAAAITNPVQINAINTLVKDMKIDGTWTKMKAVYPFVTDNRNLLGYTEDFGDATWLKGAASITSNTATAPNGTLTADTFTSTAASAAHVVVRAISLSSTFTYSLYVKKAAQRYVSIKCAFNSSTWTACNYDLDTATVTKTGQSTITGTTGTITSVGSGWYRLTLTATGAIGDCAIQYSNTSNPTFQTFGDIIATGSGVADYYLWGAQLELGSTATTYQPIATTQQAYISNQFKYNLVNPVDSDAAFRLVFNGGWTHSSNGATPNGTNGYADTKLVPSSVLMQNSTHLGYYSRTNSMGGSDIGSSNVTYNLLNFLNLRFTGNVYFCHLTSTAAQITGTSANSQGLYLGSRTSSALSKFYKNGSTVNSSTVASEGLTTSSIWLGGTNFIGSPEYSNRQTAFASIGNGLSDTEAANLYTRVQAFQTSLSRQV